MSQKLSHTGAWYRAAWPYLLTALAPLCWGGNIVLGRGMADIIPPVSFAFWRWTIAFVILLPFQPKTTFGVNIRLMLAMGLVVQVWQFLFWIEGVAAH